MGLKLDKDTPPMEREITYLLFDLCVRWGFCIPPDRADEIAKRSSLSDMEFASSVLEADEMNPQYERTWVRRIAERFQERFGTREISSSTFVDRVRGQKENWKTSG